MDRIVLTAEEANRIRDAHVSLIGANAYSEASLSAIRQAAQSSCLDRLINKLVALRNRQSASGCLLVQRLPEHPRLGPTPVQPGTLPQKEFTLLSEVVELGFALMLGEPLAYQAEKDGALVQHVFPVRSEQEAPSNESSAATLDLHTELVFSRRHPHRPLDVDSPDFVLLFCLRSDPDHQAMTLVAEIEDVCARTPPSYQSVLRQPRFEILAPYSFTRDNPDDRPWVGPVPVLGQVQTQPTAAFDLACGTRGRDAEAERALAAWRQAALSPGVISRLRLEAGGLLILDNRRCAHGRTPFSATYDGNDRWIQRVYARISLANMQPLNPKQSSRIF